MTNQPHQLEHDSLDDLSNRANRAFGELHKLADITSDMTERRRLPPGLRAARPTRTPNPRGAVLMSMGTVRPARPRRRSPVRVRVHIRFVKEDCWIGVFWKRHRFNSSPPGVDPFITFYVCIIPMLPIVIEFA